MSRVPAQALSFLTAENLDIKLTGNLDASLQMAGAGMGRPATVFILLLRECNAFPWKLCARLWRESV